MDIQSESNDVRTRTVSINPIPYGKCLTADSAVEDAITEEPCLEENTKQFLLLELIDPDDDLLEFSSISEQEQKRPKAEWWGRGKTRNLAIYHFSMEGFNRRLISIIAYP